MPIESFSQLRDIFREDAREALLAIRHARPAETLYAFALSTDDDAAATRPAGNTEEALANKLANETTAGDDRMFLEQGYRWSPDEWFEIDYSSRPPANSDPVDFLSELSEFRGRWIAKPGNSFKQFRAKVFRAMVDALRALDEEGLFGRGRDRKRVTLFISVTDSEDGGLIEIESARMLNPAIAARRMFWFPKVLYRCLFTLHYWYMRAKRGRIIAKSLAS